MVPGDMYEWSWGIFAKKTKFHDAGGPGTVVSPIVKLTMKANTAAVCGVYQLLHIINYVHG